MSNNLGIISQSHNSTGHSVLNLKGRRNALRACWRDDPGISTSSLSSLRFGW